MRRDAAQEDYLQTMGVRLVRIPNGLVLEDPEGFVRKVREHRPRGEEVADARQGLDSAHSRQGLVEEGHGLGLLHHNADRPRRQQGHTTL